MLYNVTTDMNKDLLVKCLRFYREFTIDAAGEIDVLGMWDHGDCCLSTRDQENKFYGDVQKLIDDVQMGRSLSCDKWWTIYDMLGDAIEQWDLTRGETGILDDDEYDDAMQMQFVIRMEVCEHVITNHQMVRMLADMLLGHFGADIADTRLLSGNNANTSVRGYVEYMGLDVAEHVIVTAWAMAIIGTREDGNQQVEDLALKLSDVF